MGCSGFSLWIMSWVALTSIFSTYGKDGAWLASDGFDSVNLNLDLLKQQSFGV